MPPTTSRWPTGISARQSSSTAQKTLSALAPLLAAPGVPKAGQNIKYDYLVMRNNGIDISPVAFDTMVASYVINPSRRTHNLETISLEYLGHRPISYKDVAGQRQGPGHL